MDRRSIGVAAIAMTAVAAGCSASGSSNDLEAAVVPSSGTTAAPVVMEGAVSPEIVGSWKYILGTYQFSPKGLYDVHYDYMRPSGPGRPDTHVFGDDKGSWTADSEFVYLKTSRGDIIRDTYKLSPDRRKMDLYAPHAKTPETLERQKG